jgi:hypothetical protein
MPKHRDIEALIRATLKPARKPNDDNIWASRTSTKNSSFVPLPPSTRKQSRSMTLAGSSMPISM